jgi:hypothetical protein
MVAIAKFVSGLKTEHQKDAPVERDFEGIHCPQTVLTAEY